MGECFIIGQTIGTMGNFLDRYKNGFPLNHLSLYRGGQECKKNIFKFSNAIYCQEPSQLRTIKTESKKW